MEKKDFRGLGRDAQEALRARAVYLVVTVGKTQMEAAQAVGASRQTVNGWLKRHAKAGEPALLDGRRVSPRKGKGKLTAAEAKRVQGWIRDKCPEQLKLPHVLWTAGIVQELIRRRLGKNLGLSTVHLYLLRWGFTPQKPLSRATQRSDAAIQRWLEREYPKIARRAKREKALIYWGDETGVSNQDQIGRGYAPKGRTPVMADSEEDQHLDDFGGEQPWSDAVHVLQGGAERELVHFVPEAPDQRRLRQAVSDR